MVVVVGAATVYEVLIALEALSAGSPSRDVVFLAAWTGLLLGAGTSFVHAYVVRVEAATAWLLLAPVGTAFVLARWYGFDPYYTPTLRRHSEGGVVSGVWIVALVSMALGAAALTRLLPRAGAIATGVVLALCVITAVAVGLGH